MPARLPTGPGCRGARFPAMGDVLATITRAPPPRLFHESPTAPLPRTAVELRRDRVRAGLAATIPLLLWIVTVASRVWAPDLMPFGIPQAEALDDARRVSEQLGSGTLLSGPAGRSAFALAYPLLGLLPSPVEAWIVVRALLDGVAAVLVFAVTRSLAGPGVGIIAALLYGLSPWAWAMTRDPAVSSLPVLSAGALLATTRVARSPGPVSGLVAGLLAGLLVRLDPAGWAILAAIALVLVVARIGWVTSVAAVVGIGLAAGSVLWSSAIALSIDRWGELVLAAVRDVHALAALRLFGAVAGGIGVEQRLVGIAALPAPLADVAPAVLVGVVGAGVVGLIGVGAWRCLELARGGYRAACAPLAWAAIPIPVLLGLSGGRHPEVLHSLLPAFAVLMALSAAPVGRWSARLRPAALVVTAALAALGATTIAALLWSAVTVAQVRSAVPYAAWLDADRAVTDAAVPGQPGTPSASLRFWQAVAHDARDAAARTGRDEVIVVGGASSGERAAILASLLGGEVGVRLLPPDTLVLPTEREVVFVLVPGQDAPPELAWPSARLGAVPLPPTDAAARVVTLRPRPVDHWRAMHPGGTEVRFADGTVLLAAHARSGPDGTTRVELAWLTASAGASGAGPRAAETALTYQVEGGATGEVRRSLPEPPQPEPTTSGASELVVQRLSIPGLQPGDSARVAVRLVSRSGESVPATDGSSTSDGSVEVLQPRS